MASTDSSRVLLLSMRNIARHVSRCSGYEFEDVIRRCDSVHMVAPHSPRQMDHCRVVRGVHRILGTPLIEGKVSADKEYDLFFVICHSAGDLRYIPLIRNLHEKCRRSVCLIEELWPSAIKDSYRSLEILRDFDCVFSNLNSSVDLIREATGRPCYFIPTAVDGVRFCAYPSNPPRSIDVFSMGRRSPNFHRALLEHAAESDFFYFYDTMSNFAVDDPKEHRLMLANLIQRSRYFLTYPAKFNCPDETGGFQELGPRFFEGAAGGAVLLGMPPDCDAYRACFDWPNAVVLVAENSAQICDVISDLQGRPQTVARIRAENRVHSLRRHDWVYRWELILETVGLSPSFEMIKRKQHLQTLARLVDWDIEHIADSEPHDGYAISALRRIKKN
jgi:hypothetical protein